MKRISSFSGLAFSAAAAITFLVAQPASAKHERTVQVSLAQLDAFGFPGVQFVLGLDTDVYHADGRFWCINGGEWVRARRLDGRWRATARNDVPRALRRLSRDYSSMGWGYGWGSWRRSKHKRAMPWKAKHFAKRHWRNGRHRAAYAAGYGHKDYGSRYGNGYGSNRVKDFVDDRATRARRDQRVEARRTPY